jgi:AraC-like DNA-binding protein
MPYRIDLFAVFIFLGIVQAVFLSFFFLSKENRKSPANLFEGLLLLTLASCILEIFLMYTGYIIHCLYLVDFSEPFSMAIGPLFYLMIVSMIHGSVKKIQYWHLAFPLVYILLELPFFLAPENEKYNAWIYSYHPGLPYRDVVMSYDSRWFWVTDHATETTLVSLVLYGLLSLITVVKAFRLKKESFWKPVNSTLKALRSGAFKIVSASLLILVIKFFNEKDTGDHILAAYISFTIYFTSFGVINHSGFFRKASLNEQLKYKGSSVTPDQQIALLEKLSAYMNTKPFLQPDFSLPDLAHKLNTSVHTLSQVINDGLGKSFFEMLAEYRVEEAKQLLRDKPHIKVEEIAEQVGYNSKSSFNTAFKKITGITPSEYRNR